MRGDKIDYVLLAALLIEAIYFAIYLLLRG